jgi:mitotic spindle assembly checkpoint protein MAD2B
MLTFCADVLIAHLAVFVFIEMFERRRKYEVPVWMSRHPELNEYIYQVLDNIKPLLVKVIAVVAGILRSRA